MVSIKPTKRVAAATGLELLTSPQTCDIDGPPLLIIDGRGVVLPFIPKNEKTIDAANEANPNHKNAVTACASLQRLLGLSDPLVMPLLLM